MLYVLFLKKEFTSSSGWPRTHHIVEVGPKLSNPAFQLPKYQDCTCQSLDLASTVFVIMAFGWLVWLFGFFWSVLVFYLFATESHVVQTRQVAKDDFKFLVLPPNC